MGFLEGDNIAEMFSFPMIFNLTLGSSKNKKTIVALKVIYFVKDRTISS